MVSSTLALVHSPLVGPSSWRPFTNVACARGFDVIRPDLTGVVDAERPQWRYIVDTAVDSTSDRKELVVVGHSGAGAFLPAIPVPDDWSSGPCAYLQLSRTYDEESRMANELGWPTSVLDGSHLSIFTDPSAVLAAVEDLVNRVDSTTSPGVD